MPVKTESLSDFGIRNISGYATEVNLDRAIPELYDGLKPVLRRVAWSMNSFKGGEITKSAKVVGHCFAAGTKVITYHESEMIEVPIEQLKIGQMVFSYGLEGNDPSFHVITKTFVIPQQKLLRVTYKDGTQLDCTTDQVFYRRGTFEQVRARDLKCGDELFAFSYKTSSYFYAVVISVEPLNGLHTVYDIEVEEAHTFYANGILSHNCIGTLHPHGDASVYGAMQTMVHHNVPLLEGVGNWGGLLDPAAAYRYTNAKLSKIGASVFEADYLAVTDMVPNYDNTTREPVVLPVRLPFLVLNGADGIGVGITCSIPTFTVESVVEVLTQLLSGKKLEPKDYARILKPKQHWGGHLVNSTANKKAWVELMATGKAVVQFESTLEVNEAKKTITISEWPSGLSVDKFVQKVRLFPECQRCYNSKGSTTFTVECKKTYNLPQFQAFVEKIQKLARVNVSYKFNVTHRVSETKDGVTKYDTQFLSLSVAEFFVRWCRLRLQLEKRCLEYRMERQRGVIDYSKLLIFASTKLDVIFKALRVKDSATYLVDNLGITLAQANQILDLKVRALSKLDQQALKTKLKEQEKVLKVLLKDYKQPKTKLINELPELITLIHTDKRVKEKRFNQQLTVQ